MALGILDGQHLTVWEINDKGTWAGGKVSSSRKDKRLPEGKQWVNSGWFVRFVGEAYKKSGELLKGTRIALHGAQIAQEPYMEEGEKKYPKAPQLVIFDYEVIGKLSGDTGLDKPPVVDNDGDIPW
jgi:hypothetical protein